MRKLLLQALVGFFFGVALRSCFDFDIEFLVLALFVAGFLGFIFWVRKESELILVQIAFFLAAFALGGLRYEIQDSREYVKAMEKNLGENVEVLGVLTEDPQKLEKFTRAILKTEEGVKILLSLPHYPEIKYGDKLKISGKLAEPQNFSDFDWKNYLAKDNIYFEMFLPEVSSREEGGFWLKKFLFSTKHSFIENLSKVLPEPHSSFLAGLTIGERSSLPEELEENFRDLARCPFRSVDGSFCYVRSRGDHGGFDPLGARDGKSLPSPLRAYFRRIFNDAFQPENYALCCVLPSF